MKKLMKLFAAVMALMLALSVVTVAAFAEEDELSEESGGFMPVGSTPYVIEVPAGYYDIGVDEEDVMEGMISTYIADDSDLGFDVYELPVSELYPTLEEFMTADCEAYNGTELTLDGVINGVKMTSYRSNDEYNGVVYNDMNYAFEYDGKYVALDFFWLDPASEGMAEQIMSTFKMAGVRQVSVGFSPYSIMIPKQFSESEIGKEDWEAGIIQAFSNEYSGLEIETYYFANEAGASLEEVAKAQCEAYNGTLLPETEINGIPMAEYVAVQTYDGVEYSVYVALVEDEQGTISAMAFYLNNYCAYVQAEAYMHTLGVYDSMKNVPLEATNMQLGSSGYEITLPCGYIVTPVAQEEYEEDGLLGTYVSPYSDIQIDVYQMLKATEESDELAAFTEIDAAKYSGTEINLTNTINDIPVTVYRSVETYDDITYDCLSYTFESGEYFVQACFYWMADDLSADVEAIMATLAPVADQQVAVGKDAYTLTVAADAEVNVVTEESAGFEATYISSPSGAPSVSIFTAENPAQLSLEEYAKDICVKYDGQDFVVADNGNGITLATFHIEYADPSSDEISSVITSFVEKDGTIYEFDSFVTSYAQYLQAAEIVASLKAA